MKIFLSTSQLERLEYRDRKSILFTLPSSSFPLDCSSLFAIIAISTAVADTRSRDRLNRRDIDIGDVFPVFRLGPRAIT